MCRNKFEPLLALMLLSMTLVTNVLAAEAEIDPVKIDVSADNRPPVYSDASRMAREQGRTLLKVIVDVDGKPKSVEVSESSGYLRLDQAAIEAVRGWRFIPAKQAGKPIEDWTLVPLSFRLDLKRRIRWLENEALICKGDCFVDIPEQTCAQDEAATAILRVRLDGASGQPGKVELLESSRSATLDQAALEAVSTWQLGWKKESPTGQNWEKISISFEPDTENNPKPPYPLGSRKRGEEGLVILKVEVGNCAGLSKRVNLYKSSGFQRLDDSALETVRSWYFKPAMKNGVKVESRSLIPIHFKLHD
ncbi:MAG: TonB family protein [Pseudomonadota bacterium]